MNGLQGMGLRGTASISKASLSSPHLRYPLTNAAASVRFEDGILKVCSCRVYQHA